MHFTREKLSSSSAISPPADKDLLELIARINATVAGHADEYEIHIKGWNSKEEKNHSNTSVNENTTVNPRHK